MTTFLTTEEVAELTGVRTGKNGKRREEMKAHIDGHVAHPAGAPEQEPVAWEGVTKLGIPAGTPKLIFTDKVRAQEWLSGFVDGHAWLNPLSYTTTPHHSA